MTKLNKFFSVPNPDTRTYHRTIDAVNPGLVIGLELETENCGRRSATAWQGGAEDFNFRVDRDGSLRGTAYEFISHPMRSEHALPALQDFLIWSGFNDDNYSDRCSVHVHVNCTDLEMEQISNVALLYTVAEDILFEFVGGNRESNIYCIPWAHCRAHFDLIQSFLSNPTSQLKKWNKYTALNLIPLSSYGTVEFRQMHGTADFDKLQRWINIIGSIFRMAKETELNALIAEIKTLNTTSQYEQFFQRMIGGNLPYNDKYRSKMEEGVIFAKYSLISLSKKSNKKSTDVDEGVTSGVPEPVAQVAQQYGTMLGVWVHRREAEQRGQELTRPMRDYAIRNNTTRRVVLPDNTDAFIGNIFDTGQPQEVNRTMVNGESE